jgi:hypothetical protein
MNAHDQAREYLATDGLKLSDTQKKAIFEYADWLHQKDEAVRWKQHDKETKERVVFLEKQLGAVCPHCHLAPGVHRIDCPIGG